MSEGDHESNPAPQVTEPASSGGERDSQVTLDPSGAGPLRRVAIHEPSNADIEVGETDAADLAPQSGDPLIGCILDGRYRVEGLLGEGGMGVVYRCRHEIIDKPVAMKVLRADLARDEEVTTRFLNEAKAASAIGNPHIIDISDFGRMPQGATYFVMEYLDGQPLSVLADSADAIPSGRIVHIAVQLAEGLADAHRAGIVHRDLKPDNIYLIKRGSENDFVKILDFGIAKVNSTGNTSKITHAGSVFGTPHYMSPEQAAGTPIDHRGDVYSLGVILYELASGRVPFDADNFMGILTQHMYKAPVPIRALVPEPQDVPPGLEAIVLKCLSKRPEQRYQSMDELLADLRRLSSGQVPEAVNDLMQRSAGFNVPVDYLNASSRAAHPRVPSPAGKAARWPLIAGLVGVGVAVAVVIGIFAFSARSTASPPPPAVPRPVASGGEAAAASPASPTPAPPSRPKRVAPSSRQVMVVVDPLDAHGFLGDEDLGPSPILLDLGSEGVVTLRLQREGYVSQELTVDAEQTRYAVTLDALAPTPPRATRWSAPRTAPRVQAAKPTSASEPATTGPGEAPLGGGEIINPWD